MTSNFKVTDSPIWNKDENIVVFNYHFINEIQHIPCSSNSKLLQHDSRIGIWKIKKNKN